MYRGYMNRGEMLIDTVRFVNKIYSFTVRRPKKKKKKIQQRKENKCN
jgi:uncharacterized C2H2 Zn-finger protein